MRFHEIPIITLNVKTLPARDLKDSGKYDSDPILPLSLIYGLGF